MADFGLSKVIEQKTDVMKTSKITLCNRMNIMMSDLPTCYDHLQFAEHGHIVVSVNTSFFPENIAYIILLLAPEVIRQEEYGPEVDNWTIGVLMYILYDFSVHVMLDFLIFIALFTVCQGIIHLMNMATFQSQTSWKKSSIAIITLMILFGRMFRRLVSTLQNIITIVSFDNSLLPAKDIIRKLLQSDPADRMTLKEFCSHPWIRGETAQERALSSTIERMQSFNENRKRVSSRELM